MPKQVLTKLRIDEVSAVDVGAGEGVDIKMKKRKDDLLSSTSLSSGTDIGLKLRKNALRDAQVEAYMKRDFTDEQRKQMTAVGHAMPDGSYPIGDTKDLKNAIQAIGRSKNPKKTKSHIVRRARELGATRHLPDKWVRKSLDRGVDSVASLLKSEGGEDFNTELGEMKSLAFGEGLQEAIHDASHAMKHSIESIMDDPGTADKGTAIRASFGQFLDHVQTLAPEGDVAKIAKRAKEALMASAFKKTTYMSVDQNDKTGRRQEIDAKTGKLVTVDDDQDDPRDIAPKTGMNATEGQFDGKMKKKLRKAQARFKSLLEMSKADKDAKDYIDNPDCDMDDDVKKQFIDMSKAERRAYMDANPIDEKAMQKRLEGLPSELRKQLEMGRDAAEKLAKRDEDEALKTFTKRATDARLPKELGPELVKLHKADSEALSVVMKAVDVMARSTQALEQTGYIFKEFGNRRGADVAGSTAYEQLMIKAQDAVDQNKFPTVEQALAKFFESRDPEIRELVKRGKQDGSLGIAG
jgi:hypothetical protein